VEILDISEERTVFGAHLSETSVNFMPPEDGGMTFHPNVGKSVPDHTALHQRRQ